MENNIKKILDDFNDVPETNEEFEKKVAEQKKKFIIKDNALIERIDRVFVDEKGRQLLREQY